ncbi:MAG: hypothetical protein A3K18_06460 [Lentisphaerae bacterium RIFOXYA12_64_32]|nr:MAG: hypothetical protein A3K18_06460 [Lentisphaerae bacterium RIFOXYA12_64_32]
MPINLTIPTTFEDSYLEQLDTLNGASARAGKRRVAEIYGAYQTSILGSARPSKYLPRPTQKQFRAHVRKAHSYGIDFSYAANSPCLGNIEYTAKGRRQIVDFLDQIADAGIDSIVVTIPLLIEIIRERHPHLPIVASSLCYISDIQLATRFQDMGVKRIVLDPDINRDLTLLKKFRASLQVDLEVIANHTCLISCHLENCHYNNTGHGSQRTPERREMIYSQYNLLRCTLEKLRNPGEFLASPWYAPKDLVHLEETGVQWAKLAGRGSTAEHLLALAAAYLNGRCSGNLLKLLWWPHHLAFRKTADGTALDVLDISLEEAGLDGFIDFFRKHFPCRSGCENCRYCHRKATGVLRYDKDLLQAYIANMERVLHGLLTDDVSEPDYRRQVKTWQACAKACRVPEPERAGARCRNVS